MINDYSNWFANLARAYSFKLSGGLIKQRIHDFQVDEILSFEPDGEGENVFLQIRKSGVNTDEVVKILSKFCGVPRMDIGYAGLKDKNAVTTQWFSVRLPGKKEFNWYLLENENINLLNITKNRKKLKKGTIKKNKFIIYIRGVRLEDIEDSMKYIAVQGVPNYFGEQRFGREGRNIMKLSDFFARKTKVSKTQRGILLSTARSFLFNEVLSQRVSENSWNKALPDDVFMFSNGSSIFSANSEENLQLRIDRNEISPTAVLFGKYKKTSLSLSSIEMRVIDENRWISEGLIAFGVELSRRKLKVVPQNVQCKEDDDGVEVKFDLPSGSYATTVLREILS
ncbi:MAG: tRNA pseudouridine(13) synthase TruD [Gammaproteobacteria bacterium]|nr:MAG: tRNA pseudouridine(13) synthase TruD [Gammaproteobacteria bacterium]